MVQKVDTPLPGSVQKPHWFWQIYQRINQTILDLIINPGPLEITSNGSGNGTLNLTGSQTDIWITDSNGTSQTWRILAKSGTTTKFRLYDQTRGADTLSIDGNGTVDIATPSASKPALNLNVTASTEGFTLTDGTVTGVAGTISGLSTFWGTKSNHGLQIRTNNIDQIDITNAGVVKLTKYMQETPITVASLPAAATSNKGARYFVSDANATTFASVVAGGGGNVIPVYSDGTNWRIG